MSISNKDVGQKENKAFTEHPIQIVALNVLELSSKVHKPVESEEADGSQYTISVAHSEFEEEESIFFAKMRVSMGKEENGDDFPFSICVEVEGVFTVNKELFPVDKVEHFAANNAPYLLYPYVRENFHALVSRSDLGNIMLPLVQVPSIKISK